MFGKAFQMFAQKLVCREKFLWACYHLELERNLELRCYQVRGFGGSNKITRIKVAHVNNCSLSCAKMWEIVDKLMEIQFCRERRATQPHNVAPIHDTLNQLLVCWNSKYTISYFCVHFSLKNHETKRQKMITGRRFSAVAGVEEWTSD